MPVLSDHQSQSAIKALIIGDSGAGKSGALASLAAAGYKLRILDLDNGLDILYNILKDSSPSSLGNVVYETITNKVKGSNGRVIPDGAANAFSRALNLLTHWKVADSKNPDGSVVPGYDLGPVSNWGADTVLVIDSLTFLSKQCLDYVLQLQGRTGQQPQIQDWGEAMRYLEDLLGLLYSDAIRCNVLILSHITYVEQEGTAGLKGYPNTLGSKLPPKVGRYFNSMLRIKTTGNGENRKKILRTVSEAGLELKNPAPGRVPAEIPFDKASGGLAEFFKIILGNPPVATGTTK